MKITTELFTKPSEESLSDFIERFLSEVSGKNGNILKIAIGKDIHEKHQNIWNQLFKANSNPCTFTRMAVIPTNSVEVTFETVL